MTLCELSNFYFCRRLTRHSNEHTKHALECGKVCAFLEAVREEEDASMPGDVADENKPKKSARGKAQKRPKKAARAPLKVIKQELVPIPEGLY